MEAATDYSARFEIYSASEIGAWDDLMFGKFKGQYDFVLGPAGLFATHHVKVGFLARSDLFWSSDQWKKFKGSIAEGKVASLFGEIDLEFMGSAWLASEHLVTSKRIQSVDDLKGMRVRVNGHGTEYAQALRTLGAHPVEINWADVYTALKEGTIDASVQPIAWADTGGLFGASKMIIRNPVGGHVGWLVGQKDWRGQMDSYTAELIEIAVAEAMVGLGIKMVDLENAKLDRSEGIGLDVAEFDDVDLEILHDAVRDSWRKDLNAENREIAELIGEQ